MLLRPPLFASFVLLCASCAASGAGEGADSSSDAAPSGADSGLADSARADSGLAPKDSAAPPDTAPVDAGADTHVAPPADTYVAPTDTYVAPADTYVGPPDTGPLTDAELASATVYTSPSDVASWPVTATITKLDMNLDGVHIDFTKRDGAGSWPDVPFGAPGDSLEYTLWIVIAVDGHWYTSGCIQYWRGLDRNGGPPSGYAANWYYDAIRWQKMTGHQPTVGETVGFFVTAGNARNVTDKSGSTVYERSNMVVVPFPADPGAVFTYP
ncbi:MAG: hypothetical protein NVSMB47_20880 [Polyangiales bacterium]